LLSELSPHKGETEWADRLHHRATLIGGSGASPRRDSDFYPTPPEVTIALLDYLNLLLDTRIWEPACGEGHMAAVMIIRGYDVVATDLRETGYGFGGVNYLSAPLYPCDWIITNPPFSLAYRFIMQSYDHRKPFALLLKSQFWHAANRQKLWSTIQPSEILPLTWRPDFTGQKSSLMDMIWCVWRESTNYTVYTPLSKPRLLNNLMLEE